MAAELIMLRHGRTAWNVAGRLQGRSDIPLLPETEAALSRLRVPAPYDRWRWLSSPLIRARRTAEILAGRAVATDPALIEMDFGAWEGEYLAELRRRDPAGMKANEDRGLDMQPPGGESPRMVMERLRPFLAGLAARDERVIAVAHKALIRALLAMATGWPMLGRAPVKLDWGALHRFGLDDEGGIRLIEANIPLEAK